MPEPLHRAECCSSCIWSGPRRRLLEMPPYALLLHTVPAHTPNGIPRTESRGTSARSTCTAGSRARLPGVCFRVVRDQELHAARELAEAHVPRPALHPPCLRCVHCLRAEAHVPRPVLHHPCLRCATQMPSPSPPRATPAPPSIAPKSRVAHVMKLMFWWLRLHAVSACASTPPLIGERGSAGATVTRLSRRAPSVAPPCPAQPTPPLDRIGIGSTPVTDYLPRTRAQLLSCPWRCDRHGVLLLPTALQQSAPW